LQNTGRILERRCGVGTLAGIRIQEGGSMCGWERDLLEDVAVGWREKWDRI